MRAAGDGQAGAGSHCPSTVRVGLDGLCGEAKAAAACCGGRQDLWEGNIPCGTGREIRGNGIGREVRRRVVDVGHDPPEAAAKAKSGMKGRMWVRNCPFLHKTEAESKTSSPHEKRRAAAVSSRPKCQRSINCKTII